MPCFTRIKTKLILLATIQAAAEKLGITVERRNANSYTLRNGREVITIERNAEGEAFSIRPMSGSNNWQESIIKPLTVEYTKETVKAYYKSKGYTASAGQKPNQVVFTKYTG